MRTGRWRFHKQKRNQRGNGLIKHGGNVDYVPTGMSVGTKRIDAMRNAYIDTEYSNFFSYSETKSGEILQIAIITDEGDFQSNVMPLRPEVWSKRAEEVHGITLKEAQTFPHPKTVAGKLLEFISSLRNVYTCLLYTSPSPRDS